MIEISRELLIVIIVAFACVGFLLGLIVSFTPKTEAIPEIPSGVPSVFTYVDGEQDTRQAKFYDLNQSETKEYAHILEKCGNLFEQLQDLKLKQIKALNAVISQGCSFKKISIYELEADNFGCGTIKTAIENTKKEIVNNIFNSQNGKESCDVKGIDEIKSEALSWSLN